MKTKRNLTRPCFSLDHYVLSLPRECTHFKSPSCLSYHLYTNYLRLSQISDFYFPSVFLIQVQNTQPVKSPPFPFFLKSKLSRVKENLEIRFQKTTVTLPFPLSSLNSVLSLHSFPVKSLTLCLRWSLDIILIVLYNFTDLDIISLCLYFDTRNDLVTHRRGDVLTLFTHKVNRSQAERVRPSLLVLLISTNVSFPLVLTPLSIPT